MSRWAKAGRAAAWMLWTGLAIGCGPPTIDLRLAVRHQRYKMGVTPNWAGGAHPAVARLRTVVGKRLQDVSTLADPLLSWEMDDAEPVLRR